MGMMTVMTAGTFRSMTGVCRMIGMLHMVMHLVISMHIIYFYIHISGTSIHVRTIASIKSITIMEEHNS
jgi:hypothetical protein